MADAVNPRPLLAIALLATVALSGCVANSTNSDWAYSGTQIDAAKALGRTGAGIRIGVLDTGIDVTHPALEHLTDGDTDNGELMGFRDLIDNQHGKQFAHDDHGHGTHVIGIISAKGSPLIDKILYGGVNPIGGAPNAQLWVAKVCAKDPAGDQLETVCPDDAIRDALRWMSGQNLDIVTMSLGGPHRQTIIFPDATTNAVNLLIDRGVVVIASAGNDGSGADDVSSPADIPGVIAVGAIQEDGSVWSRSSRGSGNTCSQGSIIVPSSGRCPPHQKPEVVAPGVDIWSTWKDGVYARASGTSQAAPFVASAVALLLEAEQPLRNRDDVNALKQALMDSAKPVSGQHRPHDDAAGYGLIQTMALIEAY